ncbi:vacuolar protein sorting VPS41 [Pseudohyphozyma bogoriensis]|nr:vacuolar protein sorting VPS41 [Pseudohyphozyma bogoriensis]
MPAAIPSDIIAMVLESLYDTMVEGDFPGSNAPPLANLRFIFAPFRLVSKAFCEETNRIMFRDISLLEEKHAERFIAFVSTWAVGATVRHLRLAYCTEGCVSTDSLKTLIRLCPCLSSLYFYIRNAGGIIRVLNEDLGLAVSYGIFGALPSTLKHFGMARVDHLSFIPAVQDLCETHPLLESIHLPIDKLEQTTDVKKLVETCVARNILISFVGEDDSEWRPPVGWSMDEEESSEEEAEDEGLSEEEFDEEGESVEEPAEEQKDLHLEWVEGMRHPEFWETSMFPFGQKALKFDEKKDLNGVDVGEEDDDDVEMKADSTTAGLKLIDPIPSTSGLLHSVKESGSVAKPVAVEEGEGPAEDDAVSEDEEEDEETAPTPEEEEEDGAGEDRGGEKEEEEEPPEPDPGTKEAEEGSAEEEGESASEDDDEDSEEDEDDDDEEPTLKYSRLEGGTAEILAKDSVSALTVSSAFVVLGTHNGAVFVLDHKGAIVKRFRPHAAMVNDLSIDTGSEFVASASIDGKVVVQSLSGSEPPTAFDLRRPTRCVALEPNYGKRSTRQLVSGGMAGSLILHEKGWLGYKEVTLHSGEGPIWSVVWRGTFIAWANDAGVRVYDTASGQRITYIGRAEDSPRADLFKCTLRWQDDHTLLIAWADFIKVASIKEREGKRGQLGVGLATTELYGEVTSIFQVDCMISGIASYGSDSYLILAYNTEEEDEETENPEEWKRKVGSRPELRLISKDGEELSSDAISLRDYEKFQCRDYSLCPAPTEESFYVISPMDIVVAKPRDEVDHIAWLIEQRYYEKALDALEKSGLENLGGFDVVEVGVKYLEHLIDEGKFEKAAETCPKILGINAKLWEDWVFLFANKGHMQTIIPFVPTHSPQLSRLVYEMILAHFLRHDPDALLKTIKTWPSNIYDIGAVILAVQDQLERKPGTKILMESIAELYLLNRQPGKALPYFLKLRQPNVFSLIRENNLFTDVQDQALLLIEFDLAIQKEEPSWSLKEARGDTEVPQHGTAIALLVDHTHSIPIPRVVSQLLSHRQYLFMYLDALFDKDPHLAFDYSDLQVELYAEYEPNKLMDFLRASNYYSLEKAYKVCDVRDLVPEMVFLLGRMGDNKRALNLIIERLGDVQRAIEFAKEQNDNDLWEDLLKYSETKPRFIRGLLENVGAEIDPIRLIRRIKNGLEIPGLKPALIKILQDFNLQISLMEGCKTILYSDCRQLALTLHDRQTNGFLWTGETACRDSQVPIFPQLSGAPVPAKVPFGVHFLCGDTYEGSHAFPFISDLQAPSSESNKILAAQLLETPGMGNTAQARAMGQKIRLMANLRAERDASCGACSKQV